MLERTSGSSFNAWNITNLLAKPRNLPLKPAFHAARTNLKTVFRVQINENNAHKHRTGLDCSWLSCDFGHGRETKHSKKIEDPARKARKMRRVGESWS